MRQKLLQWVKTLLFAFAAILAGAIISALPPVAVFFASVDEHRISWLIPALGAGVLGFVMMMGGILDLIMAQDRPLSHEGAEDVERSVRLAARPVAWRATTYRVFGQASGREGSESFTMRELKQAWRSGAWRRETVWRRRYFTALGALLLFWGLFGVAFTLGPPPIKAIAGFALAFGTIMIARGCWQA